MNWETFNKPEYPITPEDWPYIVTYKVYMVGSPLQSTHIYAKSKLDAIEKFTEWLGEHWYIDAQKSIASLWDCGDQRNGYHMICTGTKHQDRPLFRYYRKD